MIRYQIRSVSLLYIVNEVRANRLIPNPYFQRNLVWREVHKRDFIDTILKGYPFPQMFFSRGTIDLQAMKATSCIVDGQQRTNAILEFVDNKIATAGRYFRDLNDAEKADFFKYEIGVIELDLDNNSQEVKEIFQRLNRTSNSLTTIEKLASEYGSSEYMLVAKLLTDQLDLPGADSDDFRVDPAIPKEFFDWAGKIDALPFHGLLRDSGVFTDHEIARKVPLFHVLNMMSTLLGGYFNRNDLSIEFLEGFKESFPERDRVVNAFVGAGKLIRELKLPKNSIWFQKANFFSLCVEIASEFYEKREIDLAGTAAALAEFEQQLPEDFIQAAREAVNNKKERSIRATYVSSLVKPVV
ncbi:MAG: DUF262 domain-containing protein [Betaproteobacteria bacterium]|nr:DUF262 domain-containing protein [Betaproteobacteria bacterium]